MLARCCCGILSDATIQFGLARVHTGSTAAAHQSLSPTNQHIHTHHPPLPPTIHSCTTNSLMNTRGLVELIVLNLGLQAKILDVEIFTIVRHVTEEGTIRRLVVFVHMFSPSCVTHVYICGGASSGGGGKRSHTRRWCVCGCLCLSLIKATTTAHEDGDDGAPDSTRPLLRPTLSTYATDGDDGAHHDHHDLAHRGVHLPARPEGHRLHGRPQGAFI